MYANTGKMIHDEVAYDNAIRRNIMANAQKTFFATYADASAILEFCAQRASWNEFCASMGDAFAKYGKLTENQINAVRRMMEKANERKAAKIEASAANTAWVGNVGERAVFSLNIRKLIVMDGFYGISYFHVCEDNAGNAFVYKGTKALGDEGASVAVKATIKEHSQYNGTKQTVIARPTLQ